MLCIAHSQTDPYFNLAAEEYLLRNFSENCFMLWRNENSIIVGKHQNALNEINMDYVKKNNIRVARRISGGGTVFHDMGNLNFTFIMNGHEGHLVDFRKYTKPIIEVLRKLLVDASFHGRNDLIVNGKKISGNAEHVYKKRVLHHGTLLFSSALDDLNLALKTDPCKFRSKAVKSIRSKVTNIKEYLKTDLDVIQFRNLILEHVLKKFPGASMYELTDQDIGHITKLKNEKYSTWEWNFGYSPDYGMEKTFSANGGFIKINLNVSGGIIQKFKITGDFFNNNDVSGLEKSIPGTKHEEYELLRVLKSVSLPECFAGIPAEEFIKGMF